MRVCRAIRIREGCVDEYEKSHRAVWPEVLAALQAAGVSNYSIYRLDDLLISYFELADGVTIEDVGASLAKSEACKRWEEAMIMLQAPLDARDIQPRWRVLPEVFHMGDKF